MSISVPTYRRRETPLLGRSHRLRAIAVAGLRREVRRVSALFVIIGGALATIVPSILLVVFADALLQGQPRDLTFFYLPLGMNPAILFFATLMAAVGSNLIADDIHTNALTLYLSRPITPGDYLLAKAGVLGVLVAMIALLPLALTPLFASLLGLFPWDIGLQALGISIGVGLLLAAFYTSQSLLLSSLTSRRAYAAAGVFAVNFGLAVPAEILSPLTHQPALLYVSPWQDVLAVARAAFGVPQGAIDWPPALAILLGAIAVAGVATYVRMRAMEVVTG